MALRKKTALLVFATILIVLTLCNQPYITRLLDKSIAALSGLGSSGQEVRNIQQRLKEWGYYYGEVDGIYGYQTYNAVRNFQAKHGLTVDGIAGPETLKAIGLPTGQTSGGGSSGDSRDLNLLARLIHGEARGEPYIGQVAVGAVVLNRVKDPRFPNTIAGVIYQPGAFDVVSDGQINLEPNETAIKAARDAMNGWDPTYGCVYYYNPSTATSSWIWSRRIVLKIGKHNFAI